MSQAKNVTRTVLALIGLAGAMAFTLSRILGDSGSAKSRPDLSASTDPGGKAPARPNASEPSAAPSSEPQVKALRWEDYLSYDPFQGRGSPNLKLFALAEMPSLFFSEIVGSETANPEMIPEAIGKLALSAILGDPDRRIAIINGRTYRAGEELLGDGGEPLRDKDLGPLQVARIEQDKVTIQVGGSLYPIGLPSEAKDYIRFTGQKAPKLEKKKDE